METIEIIATVWVWSINAIIVLGILLHAAMRAQIARGEQVPRFEE